MSTPAKVMGLKMNAPIRFILDTAANWAASNYKLAQNEIAVITDDPTRIKIGNGTSRVSKDGSTFSQLPYILFSNATPMPQFRTATAINNTAGGTSAALTAGILGGLITSTSGAAVAWTLPTVAQLVTALGLTSGNARGTTIEFIIDNVLGANTITLTAGTGQTTASAITGGTTLTVASGARGVFRLYFVSTTAAILARIV